MDIKPNNIVKCKTTGQIYEVEMVTGAIVLCRPVNGTFDPSGPGYVPFKEEDLEVIIDKETDAFNLLFRDDENT